MYWMITLNWKWLFITCIVTFIQLSINGKNMKYINIVLNVLKPQEYFSISRYYQEDIKEEEKTIFGYHPHSIFSYGNYILLLQVSYVTQITKISQIKN